MYSTVAIIKIPVMTRSNSGVVWRMMRIRFFTLWELDPTFNMMRIRIQLFMLICLLSKDLRICDTDRQTPHGSSLHGPIVFLHGSMMEPRWLHCDPSWLHCELPQLPAFTLCCGFGPGYGVSLLCKFGFRLPN